MSCRILTVKNNYEKYLFVSFDSINQKLCQTNVNYINYINLYVTLLLYYKYYFESLKVTKSF